MISYDFDGKNVLVTGGARGQGLAHSVAFAKCGASVAAVDSADCGDDTSQYPLAGAEDITKARLTLEELGVGNRMFEADLRDRAAVGHLTKAVEDQFRTLDVVVHNAGINIVKPISEVSEADWDNVIGTNLKAVFFLTQALLPLISDGGSIVIISSLAALKGTPEQSCYSASKAAVLGLTRSLAAELAPRGIRVNAICPSLVVSPQSVGLARNQRSQGQRARTLVPPVLAGVSTIEPPDIAQAALWLSSGAARCITGQTIIIDAGRSL